MEVALVIFSDGHLGKKNDNRISVGERLGSRLSNGRMWFNGSCYAKARSRSLFLTRSWDIHVSVTFLEEVQVGWLGLVMTFARFPQQAPHCETLVRWKRTHVGIQKVEIGIWQSTSCIFFKYLGMEPSIG